MYRHILEILHIRNRQMETAASNQQNLKRWYSPVPILSSLFTRSAASHPLRWWLLSVFQQSSPVGWGAMILNRCVCLCVCVWACQRSFHWSVLGCTFRPIRWRELKRCFRFHLTTTTAGLDYVHAFVCAYVHGRVALAANQHSLPDAPKHDPTSLYLLTKPNLWKSHESLRKSSIAHL